MRSSRLSCLTTTLIYHAAARGIEIGAVSSELEGDLDVRGLFGVSDEVRKGFHHVRVKMRVKSDASAEELAEVSRLAWFQRSTPEPLEPSDVAVLLERVRPAAARRRLADRIAERTAGNALYVVELARSLDADSAVRTESALSEGAERVPIPPGISSPSRSG